MNTKQILTVGAILGVAALLTLGVKSTFAYQGDITKVGPNHTDEREAAIDKALESNNLAEWKKIMTENGRNPRIVEVIDTEEELAKFKEMRELKEAGKYEEAQKIREELGLGMGNGNGQGRGMGRGMHRNQ